jgi:hypothetical protein
LAFSRAVYPALAWGIFALWSTLKFAESSRFRWLVLAGTLAGITSFFRWDIGLYGTIGLAAAVFIRQFILDLQSGSRFTIRLVRRSNRGAPATACGCSNLDPVWPG